MFYTKIVLTTLTVLVMSMLHLSHAASTKDAMTVPEPMILVLIGVGVLCVGLISFWRRNN